MHWNIDVDLPTSASNGEALPNRLNIFFLSILLFSILENKYSAFESNVCAFVVLYAGNVLHFKGLQNDKKITT